MKRQLLPILLLFLSPLMTKSLQAQDIYDCKMPDYADYDNKTWAKDENFAFKIAVDRTNNKAVFIGNAGVTDVVLIEGVGAETFIEITVTGNVQTTTITEDGSAVHSRNNTIIGILLASQYYGRCEKE
jgi:hypothetical protein